jgi:hypothetical protein
VITGDTSYPTGGYTLTPALFGYTTLTGAIAHCLVGIPTNAAGFSFNPATLKLQLLTTAGVEVAAAVNVSTVSVLISGEGA